MNYSSLMKADNDYQGASSSQDKRCVVSQQNYLKPSNEKCSNISESREGDTKNPLHRNGSAFEVYEALEPERNTPLSISISNEIGNTISNEIRNRDIAAAIKLQKKRKGPLCCIFFLIRGIMFLGIVVCTAYVVTKWLEDTADTSSSGPMDQCTAKNNTNEFKEKILVVLGLNTGPSVQQKFLKIRLDSMDSVDVIPFTPSYLDYESYCGVINNTLYAVGIGSPYNELWRWSPETDEWKRLADLPSGRRKHCVAPVGDRIYVLGGWVDSNSTALDTVIVYNINSNNWSLVTKLPNSVYTAACLAYGDFIYVFGGIDSNSIDVNYVQVLDTSTGIISLSPYPMPSAQRLMRAVLWESKALLFGYRTSFIYDFHTNQWLIREKFKIYNVHFGLTLDGSTLYLSGGGYSSKDSNNQTVWTCTDEVKNLSVYDFTLNRNVSWKHHAALPAPALVHSFSPEPLYVYARK